MEYLVGVTVGLGVGVLAALAGLDRDRAFYPTVLIVIAAYYVLLPPLFANPGVPLWWPGFCGTVDLILGGWLAWRLYQSKTNVAIA